MLRELRLDPRYTTSFRASTGAKPEMKAGHVDIEIMGIGLLCMIDFRQKDDVNPLGATASQNLGPEVDPTPKLIKRSETLAAC